MRAYGKKKVRTNIGDHQDCETCHSDSKVSAARERQGARREIETEAESIERADMFFCCEFCGC